VEETCDPGVWDAESGKSVADGMEEVVVVNGSTLFCGAGGSTAGGGGGSAATAGVVDEDELVLEIELEAVILFAVVIALDDDAFKVLLSLKSTISHVNKGVEHPQIV
jgi:hypothetical protein